MIAPEKLNKTEELIKKSDRALIHLKESIKEEKDESGKTFNYLEIAKENLWLISEIHYKILLVNFLKEHKVEKLMLLDFSPVFFDINVLPPSNIRYFSRFKLEKNNSNIVNAKALLNTPLMSVEELEFIFIGEVNGVLISIEANNGNNYLRLKAKQHKAEEGQGLNILFRDSSLSKESYVFVPIVDNELTRTQLQAHDGLKKINPVNYIRAAIISQQSENNSSSNLSEIFKYIWKFCSGSHYYYEILNDRIFLEKLIASKNLESLEFLDIPKIQKPDEYYHQIIKTVYLFAVSKQNMELAKLVLRYVITTIKFDKREESEIQSYIKNEENLKELLSNNIIPFEFILDVEVSNALIGKEILTKELNELLQRFNSSLTNKNFIEIGVFWAEILNSEKDYPTFFLKMLRNYIAALPTVAANLDLSFLKILIEFLKPICIDEALKGIFWELCNELLLINFVDINNKSIFPDKESKQSFFKSYLIDIFPSYNDMQGTDSAPYAEELDNSSFTIQKVLSEEMVMIEKDFLDLALSLAIGNYKDALVQLIKARENGNKSIIMRFLEYLTTCPDPEVQAGAHNEIGNRLFFNENISFIMLSSNPLTSLEICEEKIEPKNFSKIEEAYIKAFLLGFKTKNAAPFLMEVIMLLHEIDRGKDTFLLPISFRDYDSKYIKSKLENLTKILIDCRNEFYPLLHSLCILLRSNEFFNKFDIKDIVEELKNYYDDKNCFEKYMNRQLENVEGIINGVFSKPRVSGIDNEEENIELEKNFSELKIDINKNIERIDSQHKILVEYLKDDLTNKDNAMLANFDKKLSVLHLEMHCSKKLISNLEKNKDTFDSQAELLQVLREINKNLSGIFKNEEGNLLNIIEKFIENIGYDLSNDESSRVFSIGMN